MRREKVYLLHVVEYITRIEEYVASGQDSFMESTLIQDAVVRNLQILGESARRLSDETRAGRPEVDWRGVIGFRNVIVHDYPGLSLVRVWEVVERHLPVLKCQVEATLRDSGNDT